VSRPQTVICMKWGTRYGPEYVNRLYASVMRNTTRPTRVVCYTDDATGLVEGIEPYPLPEIDLPEEWRWKPWRKMSLWQENLEGVEGDCLFLDLDLLITGNLDDFWDYKPGTFCVILNWTQKAQKIGNTSCFRFHVGQAPELYHQIQDDFWPNKKKYRNEQDMITRQLDVVNFWPAEWCVSFKHTLMPPWPLNFFQAPKLPKDAKIVVFTGKPDPEDAVVGHFPVKSAWKKLYKHVRPTPWIAEHWTE
jgi:hypothetical protein